MVVITAGTFDLFHYGHYEFLQKCARIANDKRVSVILNTDNFVKQYKGHLPAVPEADRYALLTKLPFVQHIYWNDSHDLRIAIKTVNPTWGSIIAIGSDWYEKDYAKQTMIDAKYLADKNLSLIFIPYTQGISSSSIRERILNER